MRVVAWVALGCALASTIAWGAIALPKSPSTKRPWAADHAKLARTDFLGDSVRIHDVRDFRYSAASQFTQAWYDRTYQLAELTSVWYIVTPFGSAFRGPAHTFVSISVEARREVGETYGLVTGLLRDFEVAYIIGDERDLIARRALYDGGDVYLYPIRATPEARRRLFVEMLERANALQQQPEFYNTLSNNCTSNLVDHVNRIAPGKVSSGIRTVLPGYSDAVALKLGLIDDTSSLATVRARYRINDRARRAGVGADFSRRIREP